MTTTPIPATPAAAATPPTTGTGLPTSQSLNNMFLQLLVAQLQNQDPLNPLDPSQFVGQLAQFSELSEVTQINQTLQQLAGSGSGTSGGSGTGGGTPSQISTPSSTPSPNPVAAAAPAAMISSATAAAQAAIPKFTSPATSLFNHQIQGVF